VAVFVTVEVINGISPVLLVTRDHADGAWQFLPAEPLGEPKIISLQQMARLDPTVCELCDLPPGWRARRESQKSPWIRLGGSE
jgi:hypothetical protein